ncbi:MAG: aldehyde dehydrogenase [Pseudomonadota bacterium]
MRDFPLLIGGREVAGELAPIESVNPYNQEAWARFANASPAQVEQAIAAARAAFEGPWRQVNGGQRAQLLNALADALVRQARRMGEIETIDNGKVIRETERQMHFAARNYRFFAGQADKLYGSTIPLDNPNLFDYTLREPAGVCALLVAWNSPVQLLTNKLAPALAAGCTVVIKPSEYASATLVELGRMAQEVGFPAGVINVVTGGAETGRALTSSPNVDKISFTGGVETARHIAAAAARNLKPLTLELGGKSPNIVFEDANLPAAVSGALAGIFGAAGQSCISGSRLLVQESVYAQVAGQVAERARAIRLGDPLLAETEMGPVANQAQFERVLGFIESGRRGGARLLAGGAPAREGDRARGYFIQPTVFGDASGEMEIAQEEIFGPVLTVIPFRDEEHAIAIANGTRYGLASGIWTQSLARAHRVARRLEAGTVWVNTYRTNAAQAPFGGVRDSGYGRERGLEALLEYTHVKNVMVDLASDVGDPFAMRI